MSTVKLNARHILGNQPLAALFLCALTFPLLGGCALFNCGKKESTTPCPSSSKPCGESSSTCPASDKTVSVTGSEPAPQGSVVSGEEIPKTASQGTIMEESVSYPEQQSEILRNPNIVPSGESPAAIQEQEIPSGFQGTTQNQQNTVFQNASMESGQNRIHFQTVVEE